MPDISYSPLYLSLQVAGISTIVVFISGLFIAYWFSRRQFFGKSILEALFLLPLVLPPTVVGFGLLLLFGKNGIIGKFLLESFQFQIVFTWVGAVIASAVVSFPLMYQAAHAAFQNMNRRYEQAAIMLGASPWRVFWTVTLPLCWPGLLAGLVLSFARALGEFGATLMLAGNIPGKTETLPLAIYFAVEGGRMEIAAFWVAIIVAIGFSTILWLNWWSKHTLNRHTQIKD
ncbi:hypothetical protein C2W64_02354 [Brevibacillus laterosporus]|nr:molybdate ABC transporter permease subunit [Brevibacillus laterosporus]RAP25739.1 hypothetical protein C2W64_02354 [Brevibacillus laterosporus]